MSHNFFSSNVRKYEKDVRVVTGRSKYFTILEQFWARELTDRWICRVLFPYEILYLVYKALNLTNDKQ